MGKVTTGAKARQAHPGFPQHPDTSGRVSFITVPTNQLKLVTRHPFKEKPLPTCPRNLVICCPLREKPLLPCQRKHGDSEPLSVGASNKCSQHAFAAATGPACKRSSARSVSTPVLAEPRGSTDAPCPWAQGLSLQHGKDPAPRLYEAKSCFSCSVAKRHHCVASHASTTVPKNGKQQAPRL